MVSLIYVSSAVRDFSEDELVRLLKKARLSNQRLGITGMLLYKDGNFMQVLEGPEVAVEALFSKISKDKRHHGTILLFTRKITEREFPDWSMGFQNLQGTDVHDLPGYTTFLNMPLDPDQLGPDAGAARRLLNSFRQNLVRS